MVGLVGPVHPHHAQPLRVGGREGPQPHQRGGHRRPDLMGEGAQGLAGRGTGVDHAAAGVEQRPLGLGDQLDRLGDLVHVALGLRPIAMGVSCLVGADIGAGGELHVLGNVDHDRAGAARGGDLEGLVHHVRQVLDPLHQVIVLGAGPGDADGVGLLERVRADQVGGDLSGQHHQWDGIHQGVDDAGDGVGGAGAGGHQHHAGLAGGAGIALGRVGGALLVAHQHVAQLVLVEQRVVDRKHRPARIAEDDLYALVLERAHDHFRAGHGFGLGLGLDGFVDGHGLVRGLDAGKKKGPARGLGKRDRRRLIKGSAPDRSLREYEDGAQGRCSGDGPSVMPRA